MVDFNRLLQEHKHAKLLREMKAMAIRQTVNATEETPAQTSETEENEFAMPPEFADDPATSVSHTPSAPSASSLSNEEFEDRAPNREQDEVERAKLNPPTGDWKKEDSWEYERQVISDDSMPGDFDPNGRTFLIFKGKPVAREANDLSYQPDLRLRLSPDKRYSQTKPTEIDMAHKLYLSAQDIYLEMHKEMFEKMSQLRSMLQHDAYYIRTMNGDNGIVVTGIKLKVFQGRNSR